MAAQNIEEILSYSRKIMRGNNNIGSSNCVHQKEYSADDDLCLVCIDAGDCRWVQRNHAFSDFSLRDTKQLIAELDYAREYIRAQVTFWGHHQTTCHCSSCNWLREAQAYTEHEKVAQIL